MPRPTRRAAKSQANGAVAPQVQAARARRAAAPVSTIPPHHPLNLRDTSSHRPRSQVKIAGGGTRAREETMSGVQMGNAVGREIGRTPCGYKSVCARHMKRVSVCALRDGTDNASDRHEA